MNDYRCPRRRRYPGILEAEGNPDIRGGRPRGPDGNHHCLPGRPGDWSIPERLRWRTETPQSRHRPSPCSRTGGDNG